MREVINFVFRKIVVNAFQTVSTITIFSLSKHAATNYWEQILLKLLLEFKVTLTASAYVLEVPSMTDTRNEDDEGD